MTDFAPDQLLTAVEDVLRTMPPIETFGNDTPEVFSWLGRASAVVSLWNPIKAPLFATYVNQINSNRTSEVEPGIRNMLTMLNQVRYELRLRTAGPLTLAINAGRSFDYFNEVRKVIEDAKLDLLFVDPYLDAEFASRYLPQISKGVSVRLLASHRARIASLLPAVMLFRKQTDLAVEVRSMEGLHDRYIFVDRTACYHSGASFKDGANRAPTTLTQIVDAFTVVFEMYEQRWSSAHVEQ